MARNRIINVSIWSDPKLSRVSIGARMLYLGLMNFSDDYGVIENLPRKIWGEIFPTIEDISIEDCVFWIDELLEKNILFEVEFKEKVFLIFPNWDDLQKVPNPSKNRYIDRESQEKILSEINNSNETLIRVKLESNESLMRTKLESNESLIMNKNKNKNKNSNKKYKQNNKEKEEEKEKEKILSEERKDETIGDNTSTSVDSIDPIGISSMEDETMKNPVTLEKTTLFSKSFKEEEDAITDDMKAAARKKVEEYKKQLLENSGAAT